MGFSTILFLLVFFPAALALYWLVPRRAGAQNAVLLLASALFVASFGPKSAVLFFVTVLVNYALLTRMRARDGDGTPVAGTRLRTIGVTWNLALLFLLKYAGFFDRTAQGIANALGDGAVTPALTLLVPIGLSFWTLQLIAYLIDVSYGRRAAPRSLLDYALFASFFPQVVSGPIARGELLDQIEQPRRPTAVRFARGGFTFLLGYVMKFLVAACLGARIVDPVYAAPQAWDALTHWLVLYAYGCQIFCDFAGYSLMALGLAAFFGLDLIENFRFPFLARNVSDFWKRWHISLTNILFDFIYTPLVTGSGFMRGRLGAGLFVVLLVSGLWHGATWMFVLWGALHGLVLMSAHRWDSYYRGMCRKDRVWVQRRKSRTYVTIAWALTQGWFFLSLIPFRAPDLAIAGQFVSGLFGGGEAERFAFTSLPEKLNLLLCLAFVPVYHLSGTATGRRVVTALFAVPAPLRGMTYGAVVIYLFLFKPMADGAFVYAQF